MSIPGKRIWMYTAILLLLIGAILTTQVSWIIQSARIEEDFFNHRVNMALCSAMDVLSKDKGMCSSLESCHSRTPGSFELTLTKNEKKKIDSVILQHLLFYNIQIPFQTTFTAYQTSKLKTPLASSQALLYPVTKAGMQNILVHLDLPSKNDLIRSQINGTFILSIVMLGLLTIVFVSALRALARERHIRKETVDFVNTMAHDLKTPISNISFALSMFTRDHQNINESGHGYISIIGAETDKLKKRAKQILGVASIDAVLEEESQKTKVDIHELISQSVQAFSLKLQEAKGEIQLRLNASKFIILSNQLQLMSAIVNIIDNAIIYSTTSPQVEIETNNVEDKVVVTISDNGPGIPDIEKELIFKKGYRIHNGKSHTEGFGMGLFLAKTIIEKLGGSLKLHSDVRCGSKFMIYLPAIK
jgi:signal transduction histidine kinase